MKKRLIAPALLLCAGMLILFFAVGTAGSGGTNLPASPNVTTAPAPSDFVFQGCWAYFASGPCYDIYRDGAGNYWICRNCGTTKKPGPAQCRPITIEQLNKGYWCS